MKITPYLGFNGNCAEAFRYYADLFGAQQLELLTYAESPMAPEVPAAMRDHVMHAFLSADGADLMGGDAPPGRAATSQGMCASLHTPDLARAERIFSALADGGTVTMPWASTFWSPGFGMCTDRFGTPWIINAVPAEAPSTETATAAPAGQQPA